MVFTLRYLQTGLRQQIRILLAAECYLPPPIGSFIAQVFNLRLNPDETNLVYVF